MRQRLRVAAVNLDPEHVEIRDRLDDPNVALGLGVEIEIEEQVHIRPGAVADRFEMGAQVAQYRLVDIELWGERYAKAQAPALRRPALVAAPIAR